jgi:hypothetical protein
VPPDPNALEVPAGCFFIVQDARENGFDSRVLSWTRVLGDVVGTRCFVSKAVAFFSPLSDPFGDAGKILFWCRPAKSEKFRALRGDVHRADVAADELPENREP